MQGTATYAMQVSYGPEASKQWQPGLGSLWAGSEVTEDDGS